MISKYTIDNQKELILKFFKEEVPLQKLTDDTNASDLFSHSRIKSIDATTVLDFLESTLYRDYAFIQSFINETYPDINDFIYPLIEEGYFDIYSEDDCLEFIHGELCENSLIFFKKYIENGYTVREYGYKGEPTEYFIVSNKEDTEIIDLISDIDKII